MAYTANRSVNAHDFAMVPRAEIPRSSFAMQKTLKTTFDSGYLVPIMCEEVLPGDTFNVKTTLFGRLATPIFPVMDNLHLETFFFFVPNRLVWSDWQRFMGEQANPADSISFSIPQVVSPASGYVANSLYDYFGLPTVGQVAGTNTVSHSALPMRAYNLIFNQWFRDENLQNSLGFGATNTVSDFGDGPDPYTNYTLMRRGKRADYFTSCLPWPQKGGVAVSLPLGTSAPIKSDGTNLQMRGGGGGMTGLAFAAGTVGSNLQNQSGTTGASSVNWGAAGTATTGLYADLSTATAATINQLRQSFQIQKLLERDARGGTRYTEIVRSHFGVISPDARLQRPEYLGGGHSMISMNPIAQTQGTGASGTSTPQGNLAAFGHYLAPNHGFTQSFTEHGHIIGLVAVRADLTYQQGMRKMWSRLTRYDFYFPVFAMLGEQAVLNKEIYCDGSANDTAVFGYQERWAEYRYNPSQITGLFRSTYATPLDAWHYAQKFTSLPTLASTFIQDTPPLSRNLAVGAGANGQQLLLDAFFNMQVARPLPMYSVPGLIDHF
ncbi:major capsid protein VP1 [Gokushovirinae Fen7875_21]|uniref:major capsid protein VP1 n=1 Tax=Gokushovirinae Fen7875_21 TaxID=1655659 RepID=UPI00063D58DD|nr:major capsid protein VP1 [Gokushovirinae Fen7875_21]AKI26936.1 major capsid protein VP1 [Gokushovirinae Fen7875_21]ALS03707.1 VP1 [Gokushovirus WZ-2015a]